MREKWSVFRRRMLADVGGDDALCLATQKYREARSAYQLHEAEVDRAEKAYEQERATLEARRKVWADAKLELDRIVNQPSNSPDTTP